MLHTKLALLKHENLDKIPYIVFVALCGSIIGDLYNTILIVHKIDLRMSEVYTSFFIKINSRLLYNNYKNTHL